MLKLSLLAVLSLCFAASSLRAESTTQPSTVPPVLNFKVKTLDGQETDLSKYAGKVILIVNTASKCGNTPQYKDLEELYTKYKDKGLVILGFPSNDFHQQEPGSNADIAQFCTEKYGVTFDMFEKVDVLGDSKTPLYQFLTDASTDPKYAGPITWNFEKFLIAKDGTIAARFKPKTKPSTPEVVEAIEAELNK